MKAQRHMHVMAKHFNCSIRPVAGSYRLGIHFPSLPFVDSLRGPSKSRHRHSLDSLIVCYFDLKMRPKILLSLRQSFLDSCRLEFSRSTLPRLARA